MDKKMRDICRQMLHESYVPQDTLDDISYHIGFDITMVPAEYKRSAVWKYADCLLQEYMFCKFDKYVLLNENDLGASLERVRYRLKNNYHLKDWQFDISRFSNDIEGFMAERIWLRDMPVCVPDVADNCSIITKVMDQEGFYLITQSPDQFDDATDIDWVVLVFAPKEQKNILYWVKDSESLLHVTLAKNVDNILENGFVPHGSSKRYKYRPRTYFYIEEDRTKALCYAHDLYIDHPADGSDYALLTVSTNLPDDSHFFFDPMIDGAVFTIDTISPDLITEIEHIDASKDVPFSEQVYVPRKRETKNAARAETIINDFRKSHPAIRHSCQMVSAPFKNTADLHTLRQQLVAAGISCSERSEMVDGYYFTMNFRVY